MPFLVFENTKPFGQKVFSAVIAAGAKLLVALVLSGVTIQLLETVKFTANKVIYVGDGFIYIFQLGLGAFLISQSREIGAALANGTFANRSGSGAMTGAIKGGLSAKAGGVKNFKGIVNSMKEGASKGANAVRSTRISKLGSKIGGGIRNTTNFATGEQNIFDLGKNTVTGAFNTAKEQLSHDKNEVKDNFKSLNEDRVTKESDYIKNNTAKDIYSAYKNAKNENGTFDMSKFNEIRKNQKMENLKKAKESMQKHEEADTLYKKDKKNKADGKYSDYVKGKNI
ncbi:hypothetical protein OMES3154_00203 [Oceanivirga miroungae]|uniref:Uncharacterized protein n=1 Tax=Oceanivirga miroungae TaxID=1130046 RepID=A0A6I8MCS5_9FUSO|nr:hypothetical protein OMES3154_00203 [Oceanivirga miroungae]